MFSSLFGDEEQLGVNVRGNSTKFDIPRPPPPRNATGLCGLSNLGATCYLNALLQTLHYTPEFRESLFAIGKDELGVLSEDENADNSMVRVIPIQLQRLLANLLLLDQQSASVDALTSSFGWSNNEELQQHDVQELNRILFSAIESSLVGTSGEHLISNFYRGTSVQQIICKKCGKISSREEDFLDISIPVSTHDTLQQALEELYIRTELLEAANQYRCNSCNQLVDATRTCHVEKLPLILTFALLRFCYDFNKGERYKDNSKLMFPHNLDMSPYCRSRSAEDDSSIIYELFSVVIHSGSTHSGHYTAYIRDVDNLGNWMHPEDELVQLQPSPDSGSVDFINFDSPLELLQTLLQQLGGAATVNKLCKSLQDQTGVTWNKRFKKQYGPLNKFLKANSDMFCIDDVGTVSFVQHGNKDGARKEKENDIASVVQSISGDSGNVEANETNPPLSAAAALKTNESSAKTIDSSTAVSSAVAPKQTAKKKELPPIGLRWFEFNDTMVQPITEEHIAKMFQGKQSAYMLFYRRQHLPRPSEAIGNCFYKVPLDLQDAVAQANELLRKERENFDLAMNTIKLYVHYSQHYVFANGALQRITQNKSEEVYNLSIDRRKPISDLKQMILQTAEGSFHASQDTVLHIAKKLPAGLHLYDCISVDESLPIMSLDVKDGYHVFVWDGVQVSGEMVGIGTDIEPLLLHITYPGSDGITTRELSSGFSKLTTIDQMKFTLVLFRDTGENRYCINVNDRCNEEYSLLQGSLTLMQYRYSTVSRQQKSLMCSAISTYQQVFHSTEILCNITGIPQADLLLSYFTHSGKNQTPVVTALSSNKCSLAEMKFIDGQKLIAERQVKKGFKTLAHTVADRQQQIVTVLVEDRISPIPSNAVWPTVSVEISKDEKLSSLKRLILAKLGLAEFEGECRLRIDDCNDKLGPPLYENQIITVAGVTCDCRVVIEQGPAPTSSQILLYFTLYPFTANVDHQEIIVDRKTTIKKCCSLMTEQANLEEKDWHLKKTNWCGEAAENLNDEDASLDDEGLKSGDLLLIEAGRLPPKGFVRIVVHLFKPFQDQFSNTEATTDMASSYSGVLSWVSTTLQSWISPSTSDVEKSETAGCKDNDVTVAEHPEGTKECHPGADDVSRLLKEDLRKYNFPLHGAQLELGILEISQDSTLEDLKNQILTLPVLQEYTIPTVQFLRIRELTNGSRPGKIYKQLNQSLRRHKITGYSSVCCEVLQVEENLPTTSVTFYMRIKKPGIKDYESPREVTYDCSQLGTTPTDLKKYTANLLALPMERIRLAKYKPEVFQWVDIIAHGQHGSKKSHSKKNSKSPKSNIKNSPISLRDGDTIGVKDLLYDPDGGFCTENDLVGQLILEAIQEEKRRRRKAKSHSGDVIQQSKGRQRQEIGIRIHVPDYKKAQPTNND